MGKTPRFRPLARNSLQFGLYWRLNQFCGWMPNGWRLNHSIEGQNASFWGKTPCFLALAR